MGKFRNFFVQEVEPEPKKENFDYSEYDTSDTEAQLSEVNTSTLVPDIYNENNLSDTSRSIFKVEETMNSLPKEMVTDTKRASVMSILGNFGLDEETVVEDAELRVNVLEQVQTQINADAQKDNDARASRIEDLKKEIEQLEIATQSKTEEICVANTEINTEIDRIKKLREFVEGGATS